MEGYVVTSKKYSAGYADQSEGFGALAEFLRIAPSSGWTFGFSHPWCSPKGDEPKGDESISCLGLLQFPGLVWKHGGLTPVCPTLLSLHRAIL